MAVSPPTLPALPRPLLRGVLHQAAFSVSLVVGTLLIVGAEADERRRRLEEELAAQREEAETRLREIKADTQALGRERDQMLDGIRAMANDLVDIATASVARLQPHQPVAPDHEKREAGAGNHDDPTTVATDEPASAVPAAGAQGSSAESERGG